MNALRNTLGTVRVNLEALRPIDGPPVTFDLLKPVAVRQGGAASAPESQYGWLSEQRDALLSALVHTWGVLEAAGFDNLASGVQLGQTVWFVKLNDAHAESKAAIAQATGRPA